MKRTGNSAHEFYLFFKLKGERQNDLHYGYVHTWQIRIWCRFLFPIEEKKICDPQHVNVPLSPSGEPINLIVTSWCWQNGSELRHGNVVLVSFTDKGFYRN